MKRKTPDESALIATVDYRRWILELRKRYQATQFYGSRFFECVSKDLTDSIGNPKGLSVVNIRYSQRFYELYAGVRNLQQVVEELVQVPWGHHSRIIDNCKGDARKALFYVRMTLTEGWSRSRLEDEMDSGLYDRKGKALDNFRQVLPSAESKIVRELVKSPSVGLVLCKSKDKTVVEYALSGSGRPMGVAQFKLTKAMPKELRVAASSFARLTAVVDETYAEQKKKGE